ncbi:retron system putative HNH endonuclease [Janthinobacterium sp. RB2R34]|uniref:retron system putative HNH endonuclease n=1 Tax=Janthinobacterium sp. RB2R34 TaxID=3424193 RepID=UPI003F1FD413
MGDEIRRQAPPAFEQWKVQGDEGWAPAYGDLRQPEKGELHVALLKEQGWVCCYCGRRVDKTDSHIEHYRPQNSYPALDLDYTNLFCSCNTLVEPRFPLHCGQAKGGKFDEVRHIAPSDPGCEQRFLYAADGQILPAAPDDSSAIYMIRLLALDGRYLRNRRQGVLEGLFPDDFFLTVDELLHICSVHRQPDADGRMKDLAHVIARYAEQMLALMA